MAITISGSLWTSLTMATTILGVMATSRQQAIETAERLFRAQGYAGTGLAQIITESGSPKGSFYFNFPGGKHELALEALKIFGERLYKRIDEAATMSAGDVEKFVHTVCQAQALEAQGWTLSCLVQQFANELSPGDEKITAAIALIMQSWGARIGLVFLPVAGSPARARMLAMAFIAGLSGARTMARILRSKAPFESVAATTIDTLRQSIAGRPTRRRRTAAGARNSIATH
jgi:TetR/AcrR family transcriptional repressor of lmrAB and yxaGH operons